MPCLQKLLFLQKKIVFFQEKPLQRAFSYYIILLLRSAQYGMRQKVAGGHFRVISADNRPTIGRSKGQMPEKRGAFALKNSYGTHGSVYKGAMMQAPPGPEHNLWWEGAEKPQEVPHWQRRNNK
ncbi:MAG: hypothetical protein KH334_01305 [Clostridiales bacterium]|nr:hypothetical protein [Clostridiales bacterium]